MLGFLSERFLKGKWENLFTLPVAGSRDGGLGGDLIKALSFWSLNLPMDSQLGREEKVFLIQGRSLCTSWLSADEQFYLCHHGTQKQWSHMTLD